jgi:hypothetical protein
MEPTSCRFGYGDYHICMAISPENRRLAFRTPFPRDSMGQSAVVSKQNRPPIKLLVSGRYMEIPGAVKVSRIWNFRIKISHVAIAAKHLYFQRASKSFSAPRAS